MSEGVSEWVSKCWVGVVPTMEGASKVDTKKGTNAHTHPHAHTTLLSVGMWIFLLIKLDIFNLNSDI